MTLHPALRFGMTLTLWAIGFAALSSRMQADEWNKKTIVTINAPIQVTDTVLPPGSYVFMLADSSSDRHIVQIFNRDQSRLINTVMAIPDYRVQPSGHTQFTFYETPKGNPPALHEWFYPGDNFGNEFPYPKHLQTVAAVTPNSRRKWRLRRIIPHRRRLRPRSGLRPPLSLRHCRRQLPRSPGWDWAACSRWVFSAGYGFRSLRKGGSNS